MEEGGPSLAITKNAARPAVVAGPTTQRMPSPMVIAFHAMMVGCCPPSALSSCSVLVILCDCNTIHANAGIAQIRGSSEVGFVDEYGNASIHSRRQR